VTRCREHWDIGCAVADRDAARASDPLALAVAREEARLRPPVDNFGDDARKRVWQALVLLLAHTRARTRGSVGDRLSGFGAGRGYGVTTSFSSWIVIEGIGPPRETPASPRCRTMPRSRPVFPRPRSRATRQAPDRLCG
jgi:hypothetical protein